MSYSRKRAMTWALIVLGILIAGLGAALIATFPWQQVAAQAGPGIAPGFEPGPGPWYGGPPWYGDAPRHGGAPWYAHGWRFFHGPRFLGGGLLVALVLIVVISLAAGRWRNGRREGLDAEEILRRAFAEGRITEEEYQSRLRALRK